MGKRPRSQESMTRRAMLQTMVIGGGAALLRNRFSLAHAAAVKESLLAETIYGKIRGVQVNGVSMFAGVPYGATTAGVGRFMPPSKPAKWTGVRDANAPGPRAPQTEAPLGPPTGNPVGDAIDFYFTGGGANSFELDNTKIGEDCLVLNVVTGNLSLYI